MPKKKPLSKPFLRLTERAMSANSLISTKDGILLHEFLLWQGGPYLCTKQELSIKWRDYKEPLGELIRLNLVIVLDDHLINTCYFIDNDCPNNAYKYKPVPHEQASKLFVANDLKVSKEGQAGKTLLLFQNTIWESEDFRYKQEIEIKKTWYAISAHDEGRYREESRLEELREDKTRLDENRREGENNFIPSNPSPFVATQSDRETILTFVHSWKQAFARKEDNVIEGLRNQFETYSENIQQAIRKLLTEEERDSLEDCELPW